MLRYRDNCILLRVFQRSAVKRFTGLEKKVDLIVTFYRIRNFGRRKFRRTKCRRLDCGKFGIFRRNARRHCYACRHTVHYRLFFLRSCGFGHSLHRRINTITHCKKPHLHPERKCVLDIFLVHRKCCCYNFIVEKFTAVPQKIQKHLDVTSACYLYVFIHHIGRYSKNAVPAAEIYIIIHICSVFICIILNYSL